MTIFAIGYKLGILLRIQLARPKDFGGIDFRAVVDPFIMNIVILAVAHEDEVLAWSVREFFQDGGAARISLARPIQEVAAVVCYLEANFDCQQTNRGAGKRNAQGPSRETYGPQMADGLHQQKKNYASGRRGVVGHRPNQHKKTGSAQQQKQNRKTHLAVAHGKWQAGQEQQSAAPKIGAAASYQFFLRDSPNVRPSVLVILAFPAVIEILELLVVVMHGWFSVVPQEETRGAVGPCV